MTRLGHFALSDIAGLMFSFGPEPSGRRDSASLDAAVEQVPGHPTAHFRDGGL